MEKEFIPYKQAVELKELGFDEPCFGYYNNLGSQQFILSLRNLKEDNNDSIDYFSAPTFSQAFRWFRDKHQLVGSVCEEGGYFSLWTNNSNLLLEGEEYKEFKTYEEAELACLIKLIEIVKSKKD